MDIYAIKLNILMKKNELAPRFGPRHVDKAGRIARVKLTADLMNSVDGLLSLLVIGQLACDQIDDMAVLG